MSIWKFLIAPLFSFLVAIAIYFFLSVANAVDAKLFAIVAATALCIAIWASPKMSLCAGLKMLWFVDWIVAVFPPVLVVVISQEIASVKAIRFIVVLMFTLSGLICIRRLKESKRSE